MLDYLVLVDAFGGRFQLHDTSARSVSVIDGLSGPTGIRSTPFDRPEFDGTVEPLRQYLSGRTISIQGETWAATVAAAWSDWDAIAGALLSLISADGLLQWRRTGSVLDLQATVRLAGESLPTISDGAPRIAYLATLRAADPLAYAQAAFAYSTGTPSSSGGIPFPVPFPIPLSTGAAGGAVLVPNAGNAITWPLLTVVGPIVGPVIANNDTGQVLSFTGLTVAAGSSLVVDTNPRTRSATVGGASVMGTLDWTVSTFFGVSPGGDTISFYGSGGGYAAGTVLTVSVRDAYIT